MKSIYHIIDRIPHLEKEGMYEEYEMLANMLVDSGLLRVDTGSNCNFARWVDAGKNISLMLSKEELGSDLIAQTKKNLSKIYESEKQIQRIIDNCNAQISKMLPVSHETRIKLARILVQSTHAIVIRWILLEKVEVFISYSNSIGDMMDIMTWKHSGNNSGMQSTDGRDVAIFVSTGGDPLAPTDPKIRIYGDGWPAIARMQTIAGQELGHYADIRRDKMGRQIGRHSANFSCTQATQIVKEGRAQDIKICQKIKANLMQHGMNKLINYETALIFYRKNKVSGIKVMWQKMMASIYKKKLLKLSNNPEYLFLKKFYLEDYMGVMIEAMIIDMEANLSPIADVYKREDKEAETAIACAEALARVPQQVNKWGHITTSTMMHHLYKVYYEEVIPDLINVYSNITGTPYEPNLNKIPIPLGKKFKEWAFGRFKKKDLPYRDLN